MNKLIIPLLSVLSVLWLNLATAAPLAGHDYTVIEPPQPTGNKAKIVVTEIFSYQCPHCYSFSKPFEQWAKSLPEDVLVERKAVAIGHAAWEPMAQTYYALKAMKVLDSVDQQLFTAIHKDRIPLISQQGIADWLGKQNIDVAQFDKAYNSFGVVSQVKQAEKFAGQCKIPSIPALVINGQYLISLRDDGDYSDQLAIASELIAMVRQ